MNYKIIFNKNMNIYNKNYFLNTNVINKNYSLLYNYFEFFDKTTSTKITEKTYKKIMFNSIISFKLNFIVIFLSHKKNMLKIKKFYNKLSCFWPIIKKKTGFIYYKLNYLKKAHDLFHKKKLHIQKKKTNKKIYYFNFHRKTIKYFWKSQEHFKINFLKKTRYTTDKFKNKFKKWYKKNKNSEIITKKNNLISDFLLKNLIFSYKNIINRLLVNKLILINGKTVNLSDYSIEINDIVSLPENYINFFFSYFKNKFNTIKKIKKIKFVYYSNKKSQWKDLKKKTPKILFYNVYNKNKIFNDVELDFFSSKILLAKKLNRIFDINYNNKRHNLEKLNTYKLNV